MVEEFIHHEGTKNTERKEIVTLQAFEGRLVSLSMHSSGCVARKGAKAQREFGCKLNLAPPCLQGEIIVAERFLPSLFFVRFVS